MWFPAIALLMVALPGVALAQRPPPACRGVVRPAEVAVAVRVDPAAIPLRRDLTSAAMAGMGVHGPQGQRLLGLTNSVTAAEAEVTTVLVEARTGVGVCAMPAQVVVSISHAGSWVAVASEVPAGSCRDRIVLEHENQHVRNNQAAMEARLPSLVRALRGLGLQPDMPVWANTQAEATALVQARVQAIIEAEVTRMGAIRAERDAALDTAENYAAEDARIAAACGAG